MNPTFDSMMSVMGLKRLTCKDCAFHSQSTAYPKLLCNLRGGYVAPMFACDEFKAVKS